jgi:uncharacterized protein involved in exopolysaccharide biosynthesis
MSIRPDDLTVNQENYLINFYDAQPNAGLDATIKSNLRDFKQSRNQLNALETDINAEIQALNLAKNDIEKRIQRLERKAKVKEAGMLLFKDNLIDRHFELNGEIPPLDEPATPTPI